MSCQSAKMNVEELKVDITLNSWAKYDKNEKRSLLSQALQLASYST